MILSLHDILSKEPPPVDWLIEGLIAQGERCVVYGEWGSKKSWLLLHMALHLAAGKKWLGWEVSTPRSVLYIDEEMQANTLQRRIRRLWLGAGLTDWSLPFYAVSRPGLIMDDKGASRLLAMCSKGGIGVPQVIIIEALRRVLDGSENDAATITAFWRNLAAISALGVTIIISHHMHKPAEGRGSRHSASGSGDIMAGADSAIAVLLEPDKSITVQATKGRESEEGAAFRVCLEGQPPNPVEFIRLS